MPCKWINLPGGGVAHVRYSNPPRKRCVCGNWSSKLCDFPLTGAKAGKTCDKPLCEKCAVHFDPDTDYCQPHARMIEQQKAGAAMPCPQSGYIGQKYEVRAEDADGKEFVLGWQNEAAGGLAEMVEKHPAWKNPRIIALSLRQMAIKSLDQEICPHCRAKKKRGHSFCGKCYYSLPGDMQRALYRTDGYESIWDEARDYLKENAA